jgi:hypothetical protein
MCRDGFREACPEPGCDGYYTCRDEIGCPDHSWDAYMIPDEEVDQPRVWAGDYA